jgi:4-hydroxybenzoate polyprenyltransferase
MGRIRAIDSPRFIWETAAMAAKLGPVINLIALGLAAFVAAWGAVALLSDRPSNALILFAVAVGIWGIGKALQYTFADKKPLAKR